ncbi:hypothetical protein MLD38_033016 [Melastoma candidum]|uniref:Uncharacterized protein n=1 Tax=Melastoma candidum TaxID=119954 RepID=A0ACB9M5E2_9MYRT|nr:hypothetical protein MLD38_033016 [Melastoma candidum]
MEGPKIKAEEDRLLSSFISVADDFFGDPLVLPRIGDELQAKIPLLSSNDNDPHSESQLTGSKVLSNQEALILSNDVCPVPQVDVINTHLGIENGSENFQILDVEEGDINPSSLSSWSDTEYLLGLYTFGKDFNLVKRFVDGKQMGEILLFYYGKFFGSAGYRRWSDCRKAKSRCVSGQKIYSGRRLQKNCCLDCLSGSQ